MNSIGQITVIGTGLIGGSFALAARKAGFKGRVIGCDREAVLRQAREMHAIDAGYTEPAEAVRGSQLIFLATPVGAIIDLIERIGPLIAPEALITDAGSTKREIAARARSVFGREAGQRLLPGHPMAGKERGGIQHADEELFRAAAWVITPLGETSPRAASFLELVEAVGARVVSMEPDRHDRICAWLSHVPQMLATALAATLAEEFADDPQALELGGPALRQITRTAASPYSMWRDIALTNKANLQQALLQLEQRLAHLRENLGTRELAAEFDRANHFRDSFAEDAEAPSETKK